MIDGGDIPLSVWCRSLKRQSLTVVLLFFCMEETINIYLMLVAAFVNTVNTCCLLFHLASLLLCYRSKIAKLSALCSPGHVDIFKPQRVPYGKAGHQGDKAQICPPNHRRWGQLLVADSRGNTNGLSIFVVLVHQHLDAVGVGW